MKLIKPLVLSAATAVLVGCGGAAPILSTPIENIDNIPIKITEPTDNELKNWMHADLVTDTIPGMSVDKAYAEILNGKKGQTVIVAVLDSGIDIEHEDLKNVVWKNPKEIPNNGKDDDNNGYIDDIYGWNFLGDINHEQLELVRMLNNNMFSGQALVAAKADYEKQYQEAVKNKQFYEQLIQNLKVADDIVKKELKKDTYTQEDLKTIKSTVPSVQQSVAFLDQMYTVAGSPNEAKKQLTEGIEYYTNQLNYNLNKDFDARKVLGNNPNVMNGEVYGNNKVVGPVKENAKHGTHVAGIIAAERNNGVGMNGVATNVKIMAVRTVPDGDEYDKDVAMAIRYAVDNGAKIINTSFGKPYSPHSQWVNDAIKYAASKDVLIVNAAGNDSKDLNVNDSFPNDAPKNGVEFADNFLTVGALNYKYGSELLASFSNYGSKHVDVFAPGTKIWSTTPDNKYEYLQGTSMASPAVAGVAALIRSHYPKLKAAEVKKIIMASGLSVKTKVIVGGENTNVKSLGEISTSGKIVNAYNALILADKVSRKQVNL
jgi:subtilisin family serine protease